MILLFSENAVPYYCPLSKKVQIAPTFIVEKYIIYLSANISLRIIAQTHQTNQVDILLPKTRPQVHTYTYIQF